MKNSCIYCIINNDTNKLYIGSTVDFVKRKREHINTLKRNDHYNSHLQYSWNKYGESSFEFKVLEQCDKDKLLIREQYYINLYNFNELYNLSPTAGNTLGKYKIYLTRNEEQLIIDDYVTNLLCIKQLIGRYNLTRTIIERILTTNEIKFRSRSDIKRELYKSGHIKNPMLGKHHTEEFKINHSKRMSENNPSSRRISQYALDGTFIKEWSSATQAAKTLGIRNSSQIINACRHVQLTCYGFKWEYVRS